MTTLAAYDGSALLTGPQRAEVDALLAVIESAPPGSYVDLAMHILRCGYERTQTAATNPDAPGPPPSQALVAAQPGRAAPDSPPGDAVLPGTPGRRT